MIFLAATLLFSCFSFHGKAEKEELSDKKQPGDCIDELGYLQQLTA